MQAITIAIGKNGVTFFAQHYLASTLSQLLAKMTPPDKSVSVGNFTGGVPGDDYDYSNIKIALTNGGLKNFATTFSSMSQGVTNDGKNTPIFTVGMQAQNFQAQYNWVESFHYIHNYVTVIGKIPVWHHDPGDGSNQFTYLPGFSQLIVSVVVQFLFDTTKNQWEITVKSASPSINGIQSNIPASSILQGQDNSCAGSHVDSATEQAIDSIDFATPVNQMITGILNTIPGSGDLGGGIVYDFSLSAANQLLFPNNDGIQIGIKGGASYNDTAFSGDTPPSLPLPVPPADSDTHHLNMYVSNYEVDALNWAYYKAGKLNLLIQPADIPDPDSLKVSNYTALEPSLKPYSAFVMYAHIVQNAAPVTSFQTVYLFTAAVMIVLQGKLPGNVYQLIQGLAGGAYLSQADLETFLTSATVPRQYFAEIENASKTTAMVLTQDMNFSLQIQNGQPSLPEINFRVQRVDVMTNLGLGIAPNNKNQTLQFGFANASNTPTFISSTVPGFNGTIFGPVVWPVVAEPMYAQTLAALGKTGAPLPIMQGFQFDFDKAVLSVQEGYVSILASVLYKS